MIITQSSYSLTVCTSKKVQKNRRERLLFENPHSINKNHTHPNERSYFLL